MEFLVLGVVALIAGLLIGVPTGVFIGMERMRKAVERRSVGNLRIDRSEPDEPPRPFLEVTRGISIESIAEEKFVILKVINENYLSSN